MASIRAEAIEAVFDGMRRYAAELETHMEAEAIAIMTMVHELSEDPQPTDDQTEE